MLLIMLLILFINLKFYFLQEFIYKSFLFFINMIKNHLLIYSYAPNNGIYK